MDSPDAHRHLEPKRVVLPHQLEVQHLLNAIDGVAYLVDLDGTSLGVGSPSWSRFAIDNAAPWLTPDAVLQKPYTVQTLAAKVGELLPVRKTRKRTAAIQRNWQSLPTSFAS